jgi:hypothetical protein
MTQPDPMNAFRPLVFNFLVLPAVPDDAETFLSPDGKPVVTHYDQVDWKGLGKIMQGLIRAPQSVNAYVANDGPDILDMVNIQVDDPEAQITDSDYFTRTHQAVTQARMKDFRAGVLSLPADSPLHLNPPHETGRGPLSGLVISLKFTSMLQAMDHLGGATQPLFGFPVPLPVEPGTPLPSMHDMGTLAPEIHAWLEAQFGAVYSRSCVVMMLSLTSSD